MRFSLIFSVALIFELHCLHFVLAHAESADELLRSATAALARGNALEALTLAGKAMELEPQNASATLLHGHANSTLQRHKEAVADFDKTIALDPKNAAAYDHRGSEQFKLGNITASLADFDKFLELRPEEKPGHWRRGISLYYAGRYEEGAKQFEGYEKVDTNDVENAVWHYLCTARASDTKKARESMLKIGKDRRVPLMVVYDLFRGRATPDDVLTAVKVGDPPVAQLNQRLFYANLYLGLYHEIEGDKKKTLAHLTEAVEKGQKGHYMWEVARVHAELLRKQP